MKTSVFDTPAPLLSKNEAGKIALKYFAIDGTVESLVSDRDQNFKIIDNHQSYILKISNAAEEYDVLDMQNMAMKHLAILRQNAINWPPGMAWNWIGSNPIWKAN